MVRWSVVSGLAGHMPSHLTPLPSPPPPCFPLCRSVPAPVCCQGGWTLLQEGAVVAWAWGWGGQHLNSLSPWQPWLLCGNFGEKCPRGKRQMEGGEAELSPAGLWSTKPGTCLPGWVVRLRCPLAQR